MMTEGESNGSDRIEESKAIEIKMCVWRVHAHASVWHSNSIPCRQLFCDGKHNTVGKRKEVVGRRGLYSAIRYRVLVCLCASLLICLRSARHACEGARVSVVAPKDEGKKQRTRTNTNLFFPIT